MKERLFIISFFPGLIITHPHPDEKKKFKRVMVILSSGNRVYDKLLVFGFFYKTWKISNLIKPTKNPVRHGQAGFQVSFYKFFKPAICHTPW